ncbi:MAG: WD40 repeat domain-containing protein [Thermomicrobiales bacterium]
MGVSLLLVAMMARIVRCAFGMPMAVRGQFRDHAAAILALAWSPDSQTLSSAAKDKTIRLWTVDGTLRATLPNPATEVDAVDLLAWAPDGQTLASADGPFIRFYTQEGEVRTSFRVMGTRIYAVAWSPDSQTFASAENGGVIKLWASDGKQLSSWQDNPSYIGEIAWSPNGQYLVALGGDGARFWTNEGVLQAALVDHKAPVDQVSWSPDGRTIVSSNALGLIRFWNANGSARATSEPPKSSMGKLTWSPNGQILAVGTYQEVWLWNSEGKQIATLKGHQGFAFTIAWSPNSQFLATRDETGKLLLWDATFKQCATMPSPSSTENGSGIGYLSWAPDSQSLLSLVKEGAKIWNIDGSLRATLAGKIYAPVAWSPDGSVIASGSEKGLAFWSPDGTLQRLNENMHIGSLYWSPDGQLLAVNTYLNGVPSGVQLLTAEGKTVTTLDIPPKLVSTTAIMQWSPDGAYIAFGSVADRLVRIWNRDGSPKATLDQHQSGITGLSWSPDSRLIVSSSLDGSIRIWR